jgi:hypothetical protein
MYPKLFNRLKLQVKIFDAITISVTPPLTVTKILLRLNTYNIRRRVQTVLLAVHLTVSV